MDSAVGDKVLPALKFSPADPAREHLQPFPGVRRLHVPHHVPFGREQAAALLAFEFATAAGRTSAGGACVRRGHNTLLRLADAAQRCLQDCQSAACLSPDQGSVIIGCWVRGKHHGETLLVVGTQATHL